MVFLASPDVICINLSGFYHPVRGLLQSISEVEAPIGQLLLSYKWRSVEGAYRLISASNHMEERGLYSQSKIDIFGKGEGFKI
jgi:hypothetical protein